MSSRDLGMLLLFQQMFDGSTIYTPNELLPRTVDGGLEVLLARRGGQ